RPGRARQDGTAPPCARRGWRSIMAAMHRWRRVAVGVLALGVAAAGTGLGLKTRTEAYRLLTNPIETRSLPRRVPIDYGMVYDEAAVLTADGLELAGWYVPSRNGAVVIAQHGYKGDRGEM